MLIPHSRRAFLGLLTAATGGLATACAGIEERSKATNPGAGLPPIPAGAGQPRAAVEVPPPAPIAPTTIPPTATALPPTPAPPTATAVPPTATARPPTATPQPTPTPFVYDAARLKDKIGVGQTSYAGSIPARAWNVELAAKRLHGTIVAPGEIFSFNDAVGPTTLSAGFRVGYGITMSADRPQTIPSVGGGICQVATTVFQAAYWAGLEFIERNYHIYWISRYGQPPSGKTGFDATVDDPGVDLQFRNTTKDWIRVESWVDGANIGFNLLGVATGWEIETIGPKVFNVIPTSQAPVRQEDFTMPPGNELWVEHAEDGFSATVKRLVKMNGKVLDEWEFTNRYLPSRNVLLVGAVAHPSPIATPAEPTPAPAQPTPGPTVTTGQVLPNQPPKLVPSRPTLRPLGKP
jgi:hypothetical protein